MPTTEIPGSVHDGVVLMGKPQHGKSHAGRHLEQVTGRKRGACSDVIWEFYRHLSPGYAAGDWHEIIPKEYQSAVRSELVDLGNGIEDFSPSLLSRLLYEKGVTIIDGQRRKKEVAAFRAWAHTEKLNFCWVWIDCPAVTEDVLDNTEVGPEDADLIITNDLTWAFERSLEKVLLTALGWEIKELVKA